MIRELAENSLTPTPDRQKWVGQQVGHFVLNRCIGVGRTACVFEAEDVQLGRLVAIKILSSPACDVAPLLREARMIAGMDHPNVVKVLEFGEVGDLQFIAMELMPAHVAGKLSERHHLSVPLACSIAHDAAAGLAHAHQRGVVHRDIKPSNLLLTAGDRCKVTDFGLAFSGEGEAGRLGFVGTPYYVAPEVIRGGAGEPASDIYGLGATLWHMLIGEPPFTHTSPRAILNAHVRGRLPNIQHLRGDLPPGLAHVIHQCLAKSPADRFASAGVLMDALERFVKPTAVHVKPAAAVQPKARHWRYAVAGAGALALLCASGAAIYSVNWRAAQAPPSADVKDQDAVLPLFRAEEIDKLKEVEATLNGLDTTGQPTVRVAGRVVDVEQSETGKSVRLVFAPGDAESSFQAICYSEMFDDLRKEFGKNYQVDLIGRDLEIKGILRVYKDRPRMFVRKIEQISLLDSQATEGKGK